MAASITSDVARAADVIRRGGLAAFATETVYGLGANALDPIAAARIFEAKQRPGFDPLIVHIADTAMLEGLVQDIPDAAAKLIDRFWPGPLTLVLKKKAIVPDIVTSGLETVGVRLPDHALARELIRLAGVPIAAPSANLFGHVSPTSAEHVAEQLGDRIDIILDGGPCRVGLESTVLDLSGTEPILRRPGGATLESIEAVIGQVRIGASIATGAAAPAPGMLDRHYSPRTPFRLWKPEEPVPTGNVGLLTWRHPAGDSRFNRTIDLSPTGNLVEAAANLFKAMRDLDAAGLDLILATTFPDEGLGRAINDRLRRASARG
ncbi:translation factor (SUA5) [Planctomyces sp. SCGC AG-212-M04]|nr:translation factor (SUA5) [Planctomyces sp. SCGC AG-212-M04]